MKQKVIIRATNAGVFFGEVDLESDVKGQSVTIHNCRRLWYWDGAASISQLALEGVKKPKECKFTVYVPVIIVYEVIEIIPCSQEAIKSIEGVDIWKM